MEKECWILSSFLSGIYSLWNQIIYAVANIRFPFDFIDILVMAYIIYKAIGFLRETRSGQLVKGLIVFLAIYLVARWWELATLQWALRKIIDAAIIAVVVIFQPEIRRILERMGHANITGSQLLATEKDRLEKPIADICKAAGMMQENKIGALIVFERKTQLGEIINTGTVLDAEVSPSLVNNVFFPKSPLHDGAMIVRDGRVYAAGCILPLTQRADISLALGTRHRAAIGMTENSDAVVLVVSEETGTISIVSDGVITRDYNSMSANERLRSILITDADSKKDPKIIGAFKRFFHAGKTKGKGDKE